MSTLDIAAYRTHRWIDTSHKSLASGEPITLFGIQAKIKGRRGWLHMAEGGKPLLFQSEGEARAWISGASRGPIPARLAAASKAGFTPPTATTDEGLPA